MSLYRMGYTLAPAAMRSFQSNTEPHCVNKHDDSAGLVQFLDMA